MDRVTITAALACRLYLLNTSIWNLKQHFSCPYWQKKVWHILSPAIVKDVDRQPNPQAIGCWFSSVKYKYMQSILLSKDHDPQKAVWHGHWQRALGKQPLREAIWAWSWRVVLHIYNMGQWGTQWKWNLNSNKLSVLWGHMSRGEIWAGK